MTLHMLEPILFGEYAAPSWGGMEYELSLLCVYMAVSSVITAISAVAGSPSKYGCELWLLLLHRNPLVRAAFRREHHDLRGLGLRVNRGAVIGVQALPRLLGNH